jgi:hypothetical protein
MYLLTSKSKIKVYLSSTRDSAKCDNCGNSYNCPIFDLSLYDEFDYAVLCESCINEIYDIGSCNNLAKVFGDLEKYNYINMSEDCFFLSSDTLNACCLSEKHDGCCNETFLAFGGFTICTNFISEIDSFKEISKRKHNTSKFCQYCQKMSSLSSDGIEYYNFGISSSELCSDCYENICSFISDFELNEYKEEYVLANIS